MITKDIFSYLQYKNYLSDYLSALPNGGHGFRSKLAQACGCRLSYVSEVFHRHANFSLEQAESINDLLRHTPEECDYFLLMVNFERAGSDVYGPTLRSKRIFLRRMKDASVYPAFQDYPEALMKFAVLRLIALENFLSPWSPPGSVKQGPLPFTH